MASASTSDFPKTDRTRVKRVAVRGAYDRETVYAILDEAVHCHLGFVAEGQPFVVPTIHWRSGDSLYFHGAVASRMLKTLATGADVCATVTLVDGLVFARSAFHHSMNYRSAMVFGRAGLVEDEAEKFAALEALVRHIAAPRWEDSRQPTPNEMRQTSVVRMPIEEASAKVRTGGPIDEEEDYALPHWAGVIPYAPVAGTPIPDPRLAPGIDVPDYLRQYARPQRKIGPS